MPTSERRRARTHRSLSRLAGWATAVGGVAVSPAARGSLRLIAALAANRVLEEGRFELDREGRLAVDKTAAGRELPAQLRLAAYSLLRRSGALEPAHQRAIEELLATLLEDGDPGPQTLLLALCAEGLVGGDRVEERRVREAADPRREADSDLDLMAAILCRTALAPATDPSDDPSAVSRRALAATVAAVVAGNLEKVAFLLRALAHVSPTEPVLADLERFMLNQQLASGAFGAMSYRAQMRLSAVGGEKLILEYQASAGLQAALYLAARLFGADFTYCLLGGGRRP